MSPRLLFLLNARRAPSSRRAGRPPRGLSTRDWMDAQAAAARMVPRLRVAKLPPRPDRVDHARPAEAARVRGTMAA